MVQGNDDTYIEIHPSYNFSNQQWSNLPEAVKKELIAQRQKYKRAKAIVASLYSQGYQFNDNGTVASGVTYGTQHLGLQQPFDNRSIAMVSTAQPQTQYFIPPPPPVPRAQAATPIQEVQIQQVQQGTAMQSAGGPLWKDAMNKLN